MDKKHVVILVILASAISAVLVLLFMSYSQPQQQEPAIAEISNKEPNHPPQVQLEPEQTTKMKIDSIIEQYDVIKSGRYRESMQKYKQAIRKDPPYTANSTIGSTYIKLGDYDKAIKLCEQEIQGSYNPADFYALAWIYAKIGRYEEAITLSKETTELYPDYANIWHLLGWLYARLEDDDNAIDACNNALELTPDSALVHYGLGRIYLVLDDPEKAIESYKQAIQIKSDFAEAYLFLGLTYAELGDQKKAIDSYQQAILRDRYYPEAHFFLGAAYDESGQYKRAIESFDKAITWYNSDKTKIRINSLGITPDLANLNCIIGVCHLRLGQEFKASLFFKDAIKIDDSHPGAHYGLALAYILLGEKDAAIEQYEAVKALKGQEAAKPLFDIIQKHSSSQKQ